MSDSPATVVEIDTELLNELRAESPGKSDREMFEDLARFQLGRVAIRRLQKRFNLSEDEAMAVRVEAVRDARAGSGG